MTTPSTNVEPNVNVSNFAFVIFMAVWHYYRRSIYRSCILYDSAHRRAITMMILRSDLHSRMPPHSSPLRVSCGVPFVSHTKKMTAVYPERIVIGYCTCVLISFRGHWGNRTTVPLPVKFLWRKKVNKPQEHPIWVHDITIVKLRLPLLV